MYSSILDAIKQHSDTDTDKVAVIDSKTQYTYGQFYESIKKTAYNLSELNIKKGDYVVVECSQNADYLVIDFACEMLGVVFVPVEKKAMEARVTEIFTETNAKCIIGQTDYSSIGQWYDISKVVTDDKIDKADYDSVMNENNSAVVTNGDDLAEILYSTGTTGKPKGIILSNRANVAVAENIMYGTEMSENTVEMIPLPLSHSHGIRTCYANFVNGSCVAIIDGVMNIAGFFKMIETYNVNALDISPTLAKLLIKIAKRGLQQNSDRFDYIELGTAVLDEDVKSELKLLFPNTRLYNFYGSTEAGRSCVYDFNKEDYAKCIGYPSKHAKFMITDENKAEIESSIDNIGLIAVSGDMMMDGYFNSPELTKETVIDGVIYTSDLGYIDEAGRVYVFGRADDVINYKGIKISPEEIETVANAYAGVADCACVPVPDKLCGQVPKLFIETDNPDFDKKEYMSYLRDNLEVSRVPAAVEIIEKIPRTSNGKLQRKKLFNKN